jgi:FdhE protein
MTEDVWLKKHPYLQPLAYLHAQVNRAAAEISNVCPSVPIWNNYRKDFHSGIPLLSSSSLELNLDPVETITRGIVERLASTRLPGKLAHESKALNDELCGNSDAPPIPAWLLSDDALPSCCPGLLRYIGWTALACYLRPVVNAFAGWREEEKWLRSYCPTCGSAPTMAQLAGTDPARQRFLCCGCCGTRWWYRRTGCPFCENNDDHKLGVLTIEGEGGLRIDHCESCGGYLKTYAGNSSRDFFLTEWTSMHLDIIARDHGLKRLAASLYEA